MTSYNKKCKGCGGYLSADPENACYVPKFDENKTQFCYRCFRLKYYNETNYKQTAVGNVVKTLEELNYENGQVFLITDPFDLNESLNALPKNSKSVTIVVNKMDLFSNDTNWTRLCESIIDNIKLTKLDYQEIIFCSIKSKTSLKKLDDLLHAVSKREKIYFIGKSNVGKSSLIKHLLDLYGIESAVLCSSTINTTLGLNQVRFPKYTIIDTPGFLSNDNVLNYIEPKLTSKVFNEAVIKPRIYQIKYPKSIYLENLIQVDLTPNNDVEVATCVMYVNPQITISTSKYQPEQHLIYTDRLDYQHKSDIELTKHTFELQPKSNLSISGVGLISTNNIAKIEITLAKPIKISKLVYPII